MFAPWGDGDAPYRFRYYHVRLVLSHGPSVVKKAEPSHSRTIFLMNQGFALVHAPEWL